jgi:hypothetical protein
MDFFLTINQIDLVKVSVENVEKKLLIQEIFCSGIILEIWDLNHQLFRVEAIH